MYCTGLRPKEARMLKKNEVDLEHGVLNIIETKGHDQHYVAVHESMIIIMREYDRRMEELIPERVYFFPRKKDGYRSQKWLRENFADLWKTANPAVHAISYDFRHNYATVNINKWMDLGFDFYDKLYYLSKSMGHCSVEHTKYYYSIVPRMSEILEEKSGASFEELVPEVMDDEIW
jgi:integrase